jgi:hypothetical protein
MPKAGFEPAITASERSKTVHASDRDRRWSLYNMEIRECAYGARTQRTSIRHIAIKRHLLYSRWAFARLRLCTCLILPLEMNRLLHQLNTAKINPIFSYLWSDFDVRSQVIEKWHVIIIRDTKIVKLHWLVLCLLSLILPVVCQSLLILQIRCLQTSVFSYSVVRFMTACFISRTLI